MYSGDIKPIEFVLNCPLKSDCVLIPLHNRIKDILKYWNLCAENYHKPEEFRTFLNSCIQECRNVTFVLQSNESKIPGFEEWYEEWRQHFKTDEILKWIVEARNHVVKRGDLVAKSMAKAAFLNSYSEPPTFEKEIDPFLAVAATLDILKKKGSDKEDFGQGYIKISRVWKVDDLEHELLVALSHAFSEMVKIVIAVHNQISNKEGSNYHTSPIALAHLDGRSPDMKSFDGKNDVLIKISSGKITSISRESIPKATNIEEILQNRYAFNTKKEVQDLGKKFELEDATKTGLMIAKRMLSVDKVLVPAVWLIRDDSINIVTLDFQDKSDKFMIWSHIANEIKKTNCNAIVVILDTVITPLGENTNLNRSKEEAISAESISKAGLHYSFIQPYRRIDGKIIFDELKDNTGGHSFYLDPIRRVWGIE